MTSTDITSTRTDRRHTVVPSLLGELTLVAGGPVLEGLYFPHHWHRPDPSSFGRRVDRGSDSLFEDVTRELHEYVDGRRRGFSVAARLAGDRLDRQVWDLIAAIPYGETTTYRALAARLGWALDPKQVGAAVGRNPLCILVPCHRVVSSTGALSGYAGGLRRKQFLLDLERREAAA